MDLVLSSGFLAFSRHCGFLLAVEARGLSIDAVVGTSSGALVGGLWCAGFTAEQIISELSRDRPASILRFHAAPWRGIFSTSGLVDRLRRWLPPRFEDLSRPFAAGVRDPQRRYRLLTTGPLPEAIAASCSVPGLFAPTIVQGEPFADGGAADRVGWEAWQAWRPGREAIVHRVQRSAGAADRPLAGNPALIATPRTGATFWSLGDFVGQAREADRLAAPILRGLGGTSAQ